MHLLLKPFSLILPTRASLHEQGHAEIDSLNSTSTVTATADSYGNRISSSFTKQHLFLHPYIRCSYDSLA